MTKNIVFLLFVTFALSANAQSFKFGISGGLNESAVHASPSTNTDFSTLTGFNAGAFADYNWRHLTIESGLYYTTKGYNSTTNVNVSPDITVDIFHATGKVVLNYLEVPLNLLYNFTFPAGKLFIGGGPYLDYAVSGRSTGTTVQTDDPGTTYTNSTSGSPAFGSGANEFKRAYTGIDAQTGFRLKNGLSLNFKFEYALENIINYPQGVTTGSFKSYGYSVSAGYAFL